MAENQIDPRLTIPPNVIDLSYSDDVKPSSDVPDDSDTVVEYGTTDEEFAPFDNEYTTDIGNVLQPPNYITVVSQSVKVTSGGAVVDVVIDIDDPSGTGQFEVRVTK